ncbi:hypothetical protein [Acinetobacter schindleri]|uniref:hypothetical protein n=1 Tax=Acinetobacter schindleri TaxID=108981 RepID=UPI0036F31DA0
MHFSILSKFNLLFFSILFDTPPSNLLASDEFLHKWQERNEEQDLIIVDRISVLGFLTDKERSHKVAEWAYAQAQDNGYIFWE